MSIRLSLLAILDQGQCYGNQLRLEFERRTGGMRAVNVGQVYQTLERLERDRLAARIQPDGAGYTYFRITPAGAAEVRRWFSTPTSETARADLAMKVVLAMTLPGVDAAAVIELERTFARGTIARQDSAESSERRLIVESLVLAAEAEVRWLDRCDEQLASEHPYGLATEPPKRGRPAQVTRA
ncbi:MAG: transcriptional regulator [Rhodoglobus sp.]|nr:transcriptional regulator [Rhodoglobus sp.]